MNARGLAWRSFRFYAKSHLGLLVGAFLASAILSGSMVVGDSVRASLKRAAMQRLGGVETSLVGGDRWFTEELARGMNAAPVVLIRGNVSTGGGESRANAVQVLGVDETFWKLGPESEIGELKLGANEVALNESLAAKLKLKVGDTVVVRFEAPSAISRDAPLSGSTNEEIVLRRQVGKVVTGEQFGNFQLAASQVAPDNLFVPMKELQEAVERVGLVNLMLDGTGGSKTVDAQVKLEDYAFQLKRVEGREKSWKISTDRVFLDEVVADKLLKAMPGSEGVLTYLVNGLNSPKSENRTPYSMVTASTKVIPAGEREGAGDRATITQWLAEDLNLAVGDDFTIRYFTVGMGRELKEENATFKVASILPMDDALVNRSWTPNFPGVSDVDNCRDWTPGIPVKLDAIRDKDEKYWDDYHGTPKAFIDLAKGQELWGNRFGNLTSIRFPDTGQDEAALRSELVKHLNLADIGLVPTDVRGAALAAAEGSVDFGGLFIGLSLFLIAAALVFSSLLFLFSLERRVSQMGLLLAIGWTPKMVRRAVLSEGALVALVGAGLGLLGGVAYTKLALAGLNGVWSEATVGLKLIYGTSATTLVIAFLASVLASIGTLWWSSRRMFKATARGLLTDTWQGENVAGAKKRGTGMKLLKWLPLGCVLLAVGLSWMGSQATSPQEMAGMFFGAGFLLLAGGLMAIRKRLNPVAKEQASNMRQIGVRNICRRPGRSLAVMGMMAGGIFLVIAVNAFRLGAGGDDSKRDSGTGGFALLGESTLPVYEDLNAEVAWDEFALDDKLMSAAGVKVVPFRVRQGDDASCLNLNRAQTPVLTAVNPQLMVDRGAFVFAKGGWEELLTKSPEQCLGHSRTAAMVEAPIPAVADQATAMWGLGKGVGDTLDYTDASGKVFKVQLVGLLAGSVLQGKIVVNEADYLKKYPDAAGYQFFLMDVADSAATEKVQTHLTRQLESRGLALEGAGQRLAAFNAVQNTYIGIFTVLGGLGVLLGTAGLGVLAMRNVLERRSEFGLMQALGFRPGVLRSMVFGEHVALLVIGLVLGLVSAAVAVWPNVSQSGNALPVGFLLVLNLGILAFGLIVCWLAATLALRGKLLDALRRE
ncbi:FtsX-like permease family protein [Phragmitibacter flavus]|uniref:FtsX-like permease family protein n=1 Tax=Phragmitibacter flavus TaxID=2576071 RepID=A0A5R8KEQ2_9BACT|nr:ABC transporter permease [Phragmitibacter flavus]TLD70783.1 FtsX-like permease family protein [Phragmitibacter flavus]